MPTGATAIVLQTQHDWVELTVSSGRKGWAKMDDAVSAGAANELHAWSWQELNRPSGKLLIAGTLNAQTYGWIIGWRQHWRDYDRSL